MSRISVQFSSVKLFSHVRLFVTLWTAARQACLSITNSWNPPKPMSIKSMMPSNHLVLCHPLLFLPSSPPSIRVFSSESALCIMWPKYWSFSFSISPAAAAVKSLQSCPTLCDPRDGSPPGSPVPGILQQEHWSGLPFPSPMHESEKWKGSHSVVSNSSRPHGLQPTGLLRSWEFPGKSTGMGCHCLLQLGDSFFTS